MFSGANGEGRNIESDELGRRDSDWGRLVR